MEQKTWVAKLCDSDHSIRIVRCGFLGDDDKGKGTNTPSLFLSLRYAICLTYYLLTY